MTLRPPSRVAAFETVLAQDLMLFAAWCFEVLHPSATFEHNWHIEAIMEELRRAQSGATRRLLIAMPPRHMKSLCVSVIWVAFLLGHDPSLRIILSSYGQELSGQNLRLLRTILEHNRYRAVFPGVQLSTATRTELSTTSGGFVRALSTGGVFTGFGADYIIYDDPMKQSDAQSSAERERVLNFYQGTILTRGNDPRTSRVVIVMQRVHEEDLAAHAIESGGYDVLCLPAEAEARSEHPLYSGGVHERVPGDLLWPERFSKMTLDQQRREMGDYEYALQFQQNPIPLGGGLIRVDQLTRHAQAPRRDQCLMVVQSIDPAMTDGPNSDFSVIMTFGFCEDHWWLLDVQRQRLRWPDLVDLVRTTRRQWSPDRIVVEHAGSGISLLQHLQDEWRTASRTKYPTWQAFGYRPQVGKTERMNAQTTKLKEGYLTFPEDSPWLNDLLREISAFPTGRHDDQVDALSQFLDDARRLGNPAEYGQRPSGRVRPPGRPQRQR